RRRPGVRPRGQARAAHRQSARRHLDRLRSRQAWLQEALPLQGRRVAGGGALPVRSGPRACTEEALGLLLEAAGTEARARPPARQGARLVQERARPVPCRRPPRSPLRPSDAARRRARAHARRPGGAGPRRARPGGGALEAPRLRPCRPRDLPASRAALPPHVISALDHVVLFVKDLETALAFYREVLG